MDIDTVFKALADPTRRRLLDNLRAENGQTLAKLCAHLDMSRQAVTQHLERLKRASLVVTIRRGREKLHYLNPVPIQEIYERWIEKYERQHLHALRELKKRAEGDHHG
jgi:DNA-binding transcriptional ArsR family regulator